MILEALKKLDRDKQAPERGFLVVSAAGWPAGEGSRRRLALVALAAVVIVGVVLAAYLRRAPSDPRTVAAPNVAPEQPTPAAVNTALAAPAPAVVAPPSLAPRTARADPRAPAHAAPLPMPAATRAFTLTAISQQDGRPIAVLNDRLVREGDMFDGVRIVRIGEAEVEIEIEGRRSVVSF